MLATRLTERKIDKGVEILFDVVFEELLSTLVAFDQNSYGFTSRAMGAGRRQTLP